MKIECQSCGAAYKIADEKVQGKKVFKIKCKKCSSDIIVRGTDYAEPERPAEDEATRAMDTSAGGEEPIWHVVLNGEQQGPYSIPQVREMLAGGHIDAETYVWRDGFDGWLPMQEVGELAAVFSAPSAEHEAPFMGNDLFASIAPPPAAEAPMAVAAAAPASDLYSTPEPARSNPRPVTVEPAKARAKVAGGDLFATEARAQEASKPLFSGADEAPAAQSHGDSMTGQRNENSVLFSLATLQQLSGPKEAPAPSGVASGDSSGLIDINKLAGALGATPSARSKSSVDDILTVGASGGLSSPLAAPVLAPVAVPAAVVAAPMEVPRQAAGSKGMNFAIIGAALIIVGGGIAAAMIVKGRGDGDSPNPAVAANTNTNPNPNTNPTSATPAPTAQPEAAPTPTAAPEAAPAAAAAPTAAAPAPAAPAPGNEPRERERPRDRERPASPGAAAARTTPPPSAPSAPAAAPTPAPTRRPTPAAGGSLADLMDSVAARPAGGSAGGSAPAAAASNLPEMPARPDVAGAMRGVGPAVRACGTGSGGTATVTVVFNSQGRVNTANVAPPFAGTPVGSCIARAVRDAHLPPFSRPTFSVTFPFALN
jgi:predicted Zn finger-like uncharacterized protein